MNCRIVEFLPEIVSQEFNQEKELNLVIWPPLLLDLKELFQEQEQPCLKLKIIIYFRAQKEVILARFKDRDKS